MDPAENRRTVTAAQARPGGHHWRDRKDSDHARSCDARLARSARERPDDRRRGEHPRWPCASDVDPAAQRTFNRQTEATARFGRAFARHIRGRSTRLASTSGATLSTNQAETLLQPAQAVNRRNASPRIHRASAALPGRARLSLLQLQGIGHRADAEDDRLRGPGLTYRPAS